MALAIGLPFPPLFLGGREPSHARNSGGGNLLESFYVAYVSSWGIPEVPQGSPEDPTARGTPRRREPGGPGEPAGTPRGPEDPAVGVLPLETYDLLTHTYIHKYIHTYMHT